MCVEKICCAPVNGERCTNRTVNIKSDHCEEHQAKANELYLEYKRICKIADSRDIYASFTNPKKQLQHLYECHKLLIESYEARFRHRLMAYVASKYDDGHNKQFKIVETKIDYCRTKIKELAKLIKEKEEARQAGASGEGSDEEVKTPSTAAKLKVKRIRKVVVSVPTEIKEEKTQTQMLEEIDQFEKKQQADDLEFDAILKRDRRKNKKLAKEKRKVALDCLYLIKEMIDPKYDTFFVHMCIFNLIIYLHNIDYFDDFMAKQCDKCCCNGYIPFQFKIGCSCLLNEKEDSASFMCQCVAPTHQLKMILALITEEKCRIRPLVTEFLRCYDSYGVKLISRFTTLTWKPELRRLVVSSDNFRINNKASVCMAAARKRRTREAWEKPSEDEVWSGILDSLDDFVNKNGKLPPASAKSSDTQFLYKWFNRQVGDYHGERNMLSKKSNRDLFDKFVRRHHEFFHVIGGDSDSEFEDFEDEGDEEEEEVLKFDAADLD
jgi:hypothetical protein